MEERPDDNLVQRVAKSLLSSRLKQTIRLRESGRDYSWADCPYCQQTNTITYGPLEENPNIGIEEKCSHLVFVEDTPMAEEGSECRADFDSKVEDFSNEGFSFYFKASGGK